MPMKREIKAAVPEPRTTKKAGTQHAKPVRRLGAALRRLFDGLILQTFGKDRLKAETVKLAATSKDKILANNTFGKERKTATLPKKNTAIGSQTNAALLFNILFCQSSTNLKPCLGVSTVVMLPMA